MYNLTNIRKRYIRVKVLIGPYFFYCFSPFYVYKKNKKPRATSHKSDSSRILRINQPDASYHLIYKQLPFIICKITCFSTCTINDTGKVEVKGTCIKMCFIDGFSLSYFRAS